MKSSDVQRMIAEAEAFLRSSGPEDQESVAPRKARKRRPLRPMFFHPAFAVAAAVALILGATELYLHQSPPPDDGHDLASAAPAGPGYSFLEVNRSGTPVRWNPCTPIGYVTNLVSAPPNAEADLKAAMAQVTKVTGIAFVDEGVTDDFPLDGPTVSPAKPSPVEIAWASTAETLQMKADLGPELGSAPARAVPIAAVDEITGHSVYVDGSILVEDDAASLPAGFGTGALGNLWLHELGQLIGLGDVSVAGEVMDPATLRSQSGLGEGDLAGLRRLGISSGCLTIPSGASFEPAIRVS